jgi:AICAR transformylase/IMP cyclohydrolase PurH
MTLRSLSGGWLLQTADGARVREDQLQVVTKRAPTEAELARPCFCLPCLQTRQVERHCLCERA